MWKKIKKTVLIFGLMMFTLFVYTAITVFNFSKSYSHSKSDVAIVLGAGSSDGKVSPVFKERINQAIKLYKSKKVGFLILTGGFGKDQIISDSQSAMNYAVKNGIPNQHIFIEEQSTITFENLKASYKIMEDKNLKTALIVSDPLHMKRAIKISEKMGIDCKSSPTQTSMYKSWQTKLSFLLYESFFYNVDLLLGHL